MNENRVVKYDITRIILVALVVIGHADFYYSKTAFGGIYFDEMMVQAGIADTVVHKCAMGIASFIYTFHMPAFIALSGAVFSLQYNRNPHVQLKDICIKKAKRLLIPYILVWLFWSLPIRYFVGFYNESSNVIGDILLQIVFPTNVYLWYLMALFFDFVLMTILLKLIRNKYLQFGIVILLYLFQLYLPKFADISYPLGNPLKYLLWFYVGFYIDDFISTLKDKHMWNWYTAGIGAWGGGIA